MNPSWFETALRASSHERVDAVSTLIVRLDASC
jgi:hypothetical protein